MEPVEIDIVMRQNVEDEGAKAARAIDKMAEASIDAQKQNAGLLELQRAAIARIKKELAPLEEAWKKVNVGTQDAKVLEERKKLTPVIKSLRAELAQEEKALGELEKRNASLAEKQSTLITQMRDVKNEMAQLKMAGQQESATYKEKEQQLQSLATAHRELAQEQKLLVSGSAQMQGFLSGLSALSGLLSAGGGALALFNTNSEEYAKIQTKVQSLMAITIGLQQIQNTLHQTSTFRIQTVTRAKQLWTAANVQLATSLGISTVAAQALMATLTLGLSAAIGVAVALIDKYISKQRAAREEQNKLNESIAQNASSQVANYEKLRVTYNKLANDIKSKEKFIKDNQSAFSQLGVSINDVNDADIAFIKNTEAFKSAIMQRARAAAAMDLAAEKYKESLQKQEEAGKIKPSVWRSRDVEFDKSGRPVWRDKKAMRLEKEATEIEKEGDKLIAKSVAYGNAANEILTQNGIKLAEKAVKAQRETTKRQVDELWKASEKLAKLSADIQKETDAAVVAAMEEGRDKKLAELKADYDARMALIAQRQKEIEELEKTTGVDGSKQKSQLSALADAEKTKYNAQVKAVTDGSAAAMDSVWAEINARFQTENQRRLVEINRFYAGQIAKARESGAAQLELDQIAAAHKRDIELEKQQIALETLDFESQIAIRRAQIEDKTVALQTDREEKMLRAQIAGAEKRLRKLQEIQAAGGDTGKEIEAVTVEIEAMNAELNRIPVKRLQEIAGHMKGWFSSLSGVGGELGDIFSELANGVDDVVTAYSSKDPYDRASAGISGLVKLYSIAANQIEENKRKQAEWSAKIEESAQKARMMRIEANAYQESNPFGVENPYAKAIAGAQQYATAMRELHGVIGKMEQGQVQTGTKKVVSGKNVVGGMAAGAAVGAAVGTFVPVIGNLLGAVIGGVLGGIFGATQRKMVPVFESITQKFGSILKNGTKTFELNPAILENYGKLDDATKKLVDNWEEIRSKALEAEKQMEQTFRDLAGDIGGMLSSSLSDAFRNGEVFRAVDSFGEKVTGVIEQIVEKMVFAAHFQKYFDQLKERMKSSFDTGGDGTIVDDIVWFSRVYKDSIEAYARDMEEAKKALEAQGFKTFQNDSRKAANKGIAQASQDSIDDLNGRLTFLVIKVSDIGAISTTSADLEREQLLVQSAMLGHLEVIAENSEFLKKLQNIAEDIAAMRRGVNINR